MKRKNKLNWVVISRIIVFWALLIALFLLLNSLFNPPTTNHQVVINSHKFHVGDCITYEDPNKESWEQLHPFLVHKIVEIGKHSYKILTASLISSINFRNETSYVKVKCK